MNMLDVQIIAMAAAAQVTANGNGDAIDIRDFYSHAQITLNSSAGGGADHTLDVKLQESDDGSTGWADIAGAAFTQVTNAAAAFETLTLDLDKRKRYIRPVDTVAGTSPEFSRGISLAGLKQYS